MAVKPEAGDECRTYIEECPAYMTPERLLQELATRQELNAVVDDIRDFIDEWDKGSIYSSFVERLEALLDDAKAAFDQKEK